MERAGGPGEHQPNKFIQIVTQTILANEELLLLEEDEYWGDYQEEGEHDEQPHHPVEGSYDGHVMGHCLEVQR